MSKITKKAELTKEVISAQDEDYIEPEYVEDIEKMSTELQANQCDIAVAPTLKNNLQQYLSKIGKIPSLSKEEELSLAIAYIEKKDQKAAHKLILSHLKLVAKIALSYKNYNIPAIDMISEGNLGLLRAVNKYNPQLGYRLSTYAMWWIRASIQEYILRSWSLVKKITTKQQKKLFLALVKLRKRIANLNITNNPEEYDKIAKELNCSIKDVISVEDNMMNQDVSLQQKISFNNQEHNRQVIDTLPIQKHNQETALIAYQEQNRQKQMLQEALNTLNQRELQIIQARKLIDQPKTLENLSEKYKISKERVRQIEAKAMEKIKNYITKCQNV